jgi:pyruvate,water dikinase
MAEYLVRLGIDSISLNPDTVVKTTLRVIEVEKTLGRKKQIACGPPHPSAIAH